jgi:hypothetical protein
LIIVRSASLSKRRSLPVSEFNVVCLDDAFGVKAYVVGRYVLWGPIDVLAIDPDALVVGNLEIDEFSIDVALVTREALWIVLASSIREKDHQKLSPVDIASMEPYFARLSLALRHHRAREQIIAGLKMELARFSNNLGQLT